MKRFFQTDICGVMRSLIDSVADELQISVDEDFKDFLTTFYTEAMAGMLINYFQGTEKRSRRELMDYLLLILKKSIPNLLREKSA